MRFLWGDNKNIVSKSILEIGVEEALRAVYWDVESFQERGGVYDWTRDQRGASDCGSGCGSEKAIKEMEW